MFINHLAGGSPRVLEGAQEVAGSVSKATCKLILTGGDSKGREGSDHSGFGAKNRKEAAGSLPGCPGERW